MRIPIPPSVRRAAIDWLTMIPNSWFAPDGCPQLSGATITQVDRILTGGLRLAPQPDGSVQFEAAGSGVYLFSVGADGGLGQEVATPHQPLARYQVQVWMPVGCNPSYTGLWMWLPLPFKAFVDLEEAREAASGAASRTDNACRVWDLAADGEEMVRFTGEDEW